MPRKYCHIELYGKEIFELKEKRLTHKQIGKKFGFSKDQIKQYFYRKYRNERKIAAGTAIKKKRQTGKRLYSDR